MKKYIAVATSLLLVGWGCTNNGNAKIPKNAIEAIGPTTVIVQDQEVVNGSLQIARAEFSQDVWVVVQADDNGQPGAVVARSTYSGHVLSNLQLELASDTNSPILHISVRADDGSKGQYEPEGEDKLLYYQGSLVTTKIKATYKGSSNKPTVEQNPQVYKPSTSST